MMALIFVLMLLAVVLAWIGYRRSVFFIFYIAIILASFYFYTDMTSPLIIQL